MNKFKRDISKLKRNSKKESQRILDELLKISKFPNKSKHYDRLKLSLKSTNKLDLLNKTLLDEKVHSKHSRELSNKLLKRWNKIKKNNLSKAVNSYQIATELKKRIKEKNRIQNPDHIIANSRIMFFTLIDSVCLIDADEALKLAIRMKNELIETAEAVKGIDIIGAIEVEVVAVNKMYLKSKRIIDLKNNLHKFELIKILAEEANLTKYIKHLDSTFFLIHFHGLIFTNKEQNSLSFKQQIESNPRWNKKNRQFLMSSLSEFWRNKPKSVDSNLKDIARYITKGASFRYKSDEVSDEDFIGICFNSKDTSLEFKKLLKQDESEVGEIEDSMGLTMFEISELTKTIFNIMNLNQGMNGYLIEKNSSTI